MTTSSKPPTIPSTWTIYALLDPSGRPRYVGKTNDPRRRLLAHMRESKKGKSHFSVWLRGFGNGAPGMRILEEGTGDWQAAEIDWIKRLREDGCDLLNLLEGGGTDVRHQHPAQIDLEEAQRLLDAGESVLTLALTFQVSTQAVYKRIHAGELKRPAVSTRGANGGDDRGEADP